MSQRCCTLWGILALLLFMGQVSCRKPEPADEPQEKEILPPPEPVKTASAGPSEDEVGGYETIETRTQAIPSRTDDEFRERPVGDVQWLRVFADAFPSLNRRERLLSYHLARAALAGRDLTLDQIDPAGLDIRHMVECILKEKAAKASELEKALQTYLELLSVHQGIYDALTGAKYVPDFTFEQLERAANAAYAAGGAMGLNRGESLEEKLARLRPVMFDPKHVPKRCAPADARSLPNLSTCRLNLYRGVGLRDLRGFDERYPFNSRLSRIGGRLIEQVYRTGDKRTQVPPGRYAGELKRVIGRLQDAVTTARRQERSVLSELVEHLSSGDPFAFDSAMRAWEKLVSKVEFNLGFTDFSADPRGIKALYRGVVGVEDSAASSKLKGLVRQIPYFEKRMPWSTEYRRRWGTLPNARAVQALVTTGSAGPRCRVAFSLNPDWASGERSSGKILVFTNIIESLRRGMVLPAMKEFIPAARREQVLDHLRDVYGLRIMIREVMGPYLGKTNPQFSKRLRGAGLILQALKAELTSLWLLDDPKLVELGLVSGKSAFRVALDEFLVEMLVEEALGGHDSQWPEDRARRILLRHLMERSGGVEWETVDEKVALKISDEAALREAVRKLLLRCERILVEGDRVSALRLVDRYGSKPKWPELEQVAQRAGKIGLRRLQACIMPKLRPSRGSGGRFWDASVSYKESTQRQFIRYSRY